MQGDEEEHVSKEVAQLAKALGGADKAKKTPLNLGQWSLAFDAFALGAAACGMLTFTTALAHKARGTQVCS